MEGTLVFHGSCLLEENFKGLYHVLFLDTQHKILKFHEYVPNEYLHVTISIEAYHIFTDTFA